MKIAKEIVQGLVDHHLIELTDLQSETEAFVAAKLEPVRGALTDLLKASSPDGCGCSWCVQARKGLALFEEE